ncbi:PAS domain-containing protein [Roseiconus lacunae]|uniref:PAS domain-containing protein n=1 Tax=Roseiconus lacunae TaxID=2605694 RepID=UPI001E61AD7B|nr:PAS domain-containing protein [Roseiconus lacunae]
MTATSLIQTSITPTGHERTFAESEIIVSKTDLKGIITYANHVFTRISGFTEAELLGRPHNIIRHPDMPRCVFKLLWDVIAEGQEIFAYVVNLCKNGDHYWVLAHVTPSFDNSGNIISYHSSRRKPDPEKVAKVIPLYKQLIECEASYPDWREGMQASTDLMRQVLRDAGMQYDEFVFSL